jgi:hypothetical protein
MPKRRSSTSRTRRSRRRTILKLNPILSRQLNNNGQFRFAFFEFFGAGGKETVKTARDANHDDEDDFKTRRIRTTS